MCGTFFGKRQQPAPKKPQPYPQRDPQEARRATISPRPVSSPSVSHFSGSTASGSGSSGMNLTDAVLMHHLLSSGNSPTHHGSSSGVETECSRPHVSEHSYSGSDSCFSSSSYDSGSSFDSSSSSSSWD